MLENLKITAESKRGLEWLKENYSFTTYSVAVDTAVQFFKNNKINPRETISNNYTESLMLVRNEIIDLKKFINADSQSLRKRHYAIERDYFVGMNRKLDIVSKILINDSIEKNNESIRKEITDKADNSDSVVLKLRKEVKEYSELLKKYSNTVDAQETIFKEYRKHFKTIKKNISYEKNTFGKSKVVIDLPQAEVEAIFDLLEKL